MKLAGHSYNILRVNFARLASAHTMPATPEQRVAAHCGPDETKLQKVTCNRMWTKVQSRGHHRNYECKSSMVDLLGTWRRKPKQQEVRQVHSGQQCLHRAVIYLTGSKWHDPFALPATRELQQLHCVRYLLSSPPTNKPRSGEHGCIWLGTQVL
eukprot:2945312-Amphidinium_carterae.1